MNRCTQFDEILHEHVPREPLKPYWISRSYVKGQGHMFSVCFPCAWWCGYPRTVLSLEQGLMILFRKFSSAAKLAVSGAAEWLTRLARIRGCTVHGWCHACVTVTWTSTRDRQLLAWTSPPRWSGLFDHRIVSTPPDLRRSRLYTDCVP